jgi:hypothetical protein
LPKPINLGKKVLKIDQSLLREADLIEPQGPRDRWKEKGVDVCLRLNLVESFDPTVNTVIDGFFKPFDHSSSCGTFFPHNFDARYMNDFSHISLPLFCSSTPS